LQSNTEQYASNIGVVGIVIICYVPNKIQAAMGMCTGEEGATAQIKLI